MKILLKPHSGLANRIRVMVSGISLAEKLNCTLEIIWENDRGLNCDYFDLFQKNAYLDIKSSNQKTIFLDKLRAKPIFFKAAQRIFNVGFVMYDADMQKYVWSTGSDYLDLSLISDITGDIYIKSCNDFYYKSENLRHFLPTDEIQKQIDFNTRSFSSSTIGIHIRRTDHQKSILESPTEEFKKKMRIEVLENAGMTFYVATDDAEVRNELIREFGDRIFYADTVLNRDSKEGIQGAMVDLYALSRTAKIYGSYWSSYSDIAARIGNIPLVVVRN